MADRLRLPMGAVPAQLRAEAFFAVWTRKEACIKARGGSLAIALDKFEVALAPGWPSRLLSIQDGPRAASHWSLRQLALRPGYAGALVVEG